MIQRLLLFFCLYTALLLSMPTATALASQPPILGDFDEGLPGAFVAFNDTGDTVDISRVSTTSITALPGRPGQNTENQVLQIEFDVQGFGGVVEPYFETANDWTGYAGVGFWFYGSGSGNEYQFEIYENRTDLAADPKTGERFEVRFIDLKAGWRKLTFSFDQFRRSTDFQEPEAPDDGFTLDAVSGYSIVLPLEAADTVYIDEIQLLANDPISNFETGLAFGMFIFPGNDTTNVVTQTATIIDDSDPMSLPGQLGENKVLEVPYSIQQFGGFTHTFDPTPRDWSDFAGISFWLFGEGSNNRYQFEIFDNRSDTSADTSERFEYKLADTFEGWRFFQIPFSEFERATDYQPDGAPEDGMGLDEVWGYSVTLPLGDGTLRMDDIQLYNFEAIPSSLLLVDYEQGPAPGFFKFSGAASNVITDMVTIEPSSPLSLPNQLEADQVFSVVYENNDFAGMNQPLRQAPQSWVGSTGIRFSFFGSGTNAGYEFEIFTNRIDPASGSEVFETVFFDSIIGWHTIELPFSEFTRANSQPDGAPDDGFTLSEVWAYGITLPQGNGSFFINDIELVRTIDVANYDSVALGSIFSFDGISSTVSSEVITVDDDDLLALPGAIRPNQLLEVQYKVEDFGGFSTSFEPFPRDWSAFIGLSFWFYGSNTQNRFQLELRDNSPDASFDNAEIFETILVDDFTGWRQIQIPFSNFERARDFQPAGAPDDGLTLSEMWGYTITLPLGTGVFYMDNISLVRTGVGLPPGLYLPLNLQ